MPGTDTTMSEPSRANSQKPMLYARTPGPLWDRSSDMLFIPLPADELDPDRKRTWDIITDLLANEKIQTARLRYKPLRSLPSSQRDAASSGTSGDRCSLKAADYGESGAWGPIDPSHVTTRITLIYSPLEGYQHPAEPSLWMNPMLYVTENTDTGEYSVDAGLHLGHFVPPDAVQKFQKDLVGRVTDVFGSSAWQSVKSDMGNMAQTGVLHSAADMLTRLSEAVQTALQEKKNKLETQGDLSTHGSPPFTTETTTVSGDSETDDDAIADSTKSLNRSEGSASLSESISDMSVRSPTTATTASGGTLASL